MITIVEKKSGPPKGMTQEELEARLYPNFLALARILARDIIKDQEREQKRLKEAKENVGSVSTSKGLEEVDKSS